MVNYINGAIKEAMAKGRALMSKIPGARDLSIYFASLATIANREIEQILYELDYVYNDEDYNDPINIRQKYYRFKQLSGKLADIENVVIAAMSRKSKDDEYVNELVDQICKEINYPLQTPVASCLSQKYYHIYPYYNLLCIPLLESEFILHLPDIYHELGHPLIAMDTNPKVEPFRNNLGYFNVEVRKYFDAEIKRRDRNKSIDAEFDPIYVWKDSWLENWSTELFCDLFATFTLGPAYVWSNIHMCTKMSWDSYKLPNFKKASHPPDEARMKTVLYGLQEIGFKSEVPILQKKWDEFKEIVRPVKPNNFSTAFPEKLLKQAVEFCLVGTKQLNCEIAKPGQGGKVNSLLNNSWIDFWKNPEGFAELEKKTVAQFKASLKNL